MMKLREALRCKAEKWRIEMKVELTRILVQTHKMIHPAARSPEKGDPDSSGGVFLSRSQNKVGQVSLWSKIRLIIKSMVSPIRYTPLYYSLHRV
ncbi:hypothetical protein Ddye_029507 [Dipteronia dyeriana]|uniref:Uncharacterized protein n=1 Tax=Dipteronia dyeriana TaxID=168575 RepID=A0AAD9TEK9_9ROSI|nr:hypothetical protein Ddye_029507 [Dipteronia dyeriana]